MSKKNSTREQSREEEGMSLVVQLFCDHIQSLSAGEVFDLGGGRYVHRTRKGFTLVDGAIPSELVDRVKYTVSSAGFASVHIHDDKGRSGRCSRR